MNAPDSLHLKSLREAAACECIYSCADSPKTACSLSGEWHVHPEWPCAVHPDAPGDHADTEVATRPSLADLEAQYREGVATR